MANSLFPAFFRIFYHSQRASHAMTIPTRPWLGTPGQFIAGAFNNWEDDPVDADTMIEAYADAIAAAMFTDEVTLDSYIIYHFPSESVAPVPVYTAPLAVEGSLVSATWNLGVQTTYMWRTATFGLFKIVSLDGPSGDSFEDNISWGAGSPGSVVDALVTDPTQAFSGRDNARPAIFDHYSRTMNDKLLAKYGDNVV